MILGAPAKRFAISRDDEAMKRVALIVLFPARYVAFLTEPHSGSPAMLHIPESPSTHADRAEHAA
jgi:hypothetical protein